jgi:hypothetical protein
MKRYSCNSAPGKDRLTTREPLVVAFAPGEKFIGALMYEVRLQMVTGGKLFEFVCRSITLPVTFEYLRHGQQALLCVTGICQAILKESFDLGRHLGNRKNFSLDRSRRAALFEGPALSFTT